MCLKSGQKLEYLSEPNVTGQAREPLKNCMGMDWNIYSLLKIIKESGATGFQLRAD